MTAESGWVTDAELVSRIVQGDEAAFGEAYDRHAEAVFRAAMRMLGDRFAAEEVVQETWLVLWNRAERFDASLGSLIAWLLTIARNRSLDRLRAARRRPALVSVGGSDDEPDAEALERAMAAGGRVDGSAEEHDPEAAAMLRWQRSVVRGVLDVLPDPERRAIELAYDEGLSQAEIAVRLGWPLGTVKTRTRRALLRLRAALGNTLEEDQAARAGAAPRRDTTPHGVPRTRVQLSGMTDTGENLDGAR